MRLEINLTEEERRVVMAYTKMHGISLEDACKEALFEKIEDEMDTKIAEEAYKKYLESGEKGYSHEEAKKVLGIEA